MNIYGIVILSIVMIQFVVTCIETWLIHRSLHQPVPDELSDVYDHDRYLQSQAYQRECNTFSLLGSVLNTALFLMAWGLGIFPWLDNWCRRIIDGMWAQEVITGVLFISALLLVNWLMSWPLSLYKTFVIEARYGFNRSTVKTWISDRVKGLLLGAVLLVPFMGLVLALFVYGGSWAWVYAWLFVVLVTLLLQLIFPTWIMPMFNKFTPLQEGDLRDAITDLSQKVNFPFKDIFVVDGSRRSNKANAFFAGYGKSKRIALYDTLIEQQTTQELLAVFAHEVGHYKHKHIPIMMAVSIAQKGLILFLFSLFVTQQGLFDAFGFNMPNVHAGLIFFLILYTPIGMVLDVINNTLSRHHEYQADHYAKINVEDGATHLSSALKKLTANNMSALTPDPFHVWLRYSHPPLRSRLAALQKNIT